jgi:hypothetical protein
MARPRTVTYMLVTPPKIDSLHSRLAEAIGPEHANTAMALLLDAPADDRAEVLELRCRVADAEARFVTLAARVLELEDLVTGPRSAVPELALRIAAGELDLARAG